MAHAGLTLLLSVLFILSAPGLSAMGQPDGPSSRDMVEQPLVDWPPDNLANSSMRPEFTFFANYTGEGLTWTLELASDKDFTSMYKTFASNKDGGFRNIDVPLDIQPFRPSDQMAFQPLSDLDPGTYWWRAMAEDTTVAGSAGPWSVYRSLTLVDGLGHPEWSQVTPAQLLSEAHKNLEVKGDGVALGTADVFVFEDTFASTVLDANRWPVSSGPATVDNVGSHEPSEPYSLRMNGHTDRGDLVESRAIDLSEFSNGSLEFYWQAGGGGNSPDPGESLRIEANLDTGWSEVFMRDGSGANMDEFTHEVLKLPAGSFHEDFKIKIHNNAFGAGDDWFVDDIVVRGNSYKDGHLISDPVYFEDGPPRKKGWSKVRFTATGNVTVAVQSESEGWTGLEAKAQQGETVIDITSLGSEPILRLRANFSEPTTEPFLESWSLEWTKPEAPFVNVLKPEPGEGLDVNDYYTIEWEATEEANPLAANPISIFLSYNGTEGPFETIVNGITNTGSYSWKVPGNISDNCAIKVEAIDDQPEPIYGSDVMDGTFSISAKPPSVTLLSPNGDEDLNAGESYTIRWQTTPGSIDLPLRPVTIQLSTKGASGTYESIFDDIADTGNITWKVPQVDSSACFLRITVKDNQAEPLTATDLNDQQFTIWPDNVRPYVVVSDPVDGEKDFPTLKPVSIMFSEEMNKGATENAVTIVPKVTVNFVWNENTLIIAPSQGLQQDTTYTVTIDQSATDANGNNLVGPYEVKFSTGKAEGTAFERWSFVILSLFVVGLGLGLATGGYLLKRKSDEIEDLKAPTVIDEIFLMSKSGKLIKHYTRRLKPDVDQDILTGMLVAVQNFVKDTFKGEEGQLEEMTFGEFKTLIVRGKFAMIAAVVKGPDPSKLKDQLLGCLTEMEKKQRKMLKDWDGDSLGLGNLDPYMRGLIAGRYKNRD